MPTRLLPNQSLPLGPTFVEAVRKNSALCVDFGETVPEIDDVPTKMDIGSIELVARHNGAEVNLASIEPSTYAQANYEKSAGLIDINLGHLSDEEWAVVESGEVFLRVGGHEVSREREFVVVAEDRDIYIDQDETKEIVLKVLRRGKAAGAGVRVLVARYVKQYVVAQGRRRLTFLYDGTVDTLTTSDDGQVVFSIAAVEPSLNTYVFYAYDADGTGPEPDEEFSKSNHFYVNIRTLPFDNDLATNTPDNKLTWQWIYDNILAVYDVINPVMARPSIGLPLHDRQAMEASVVDIKRRIQKANFESARYMPVTRDLSHGKRALLTRWCNLVEQGAVPMMVARSETKTSSSDPRV